MKIDKKLILATAWKRFREAWMGVRPKSFDRFDGVLSIKNEGGETNQISPDQSM
jgi:hypothetical protein